MTNLAMQTMVEPPKKPVASANEIPRFLCIDLAITDSDCISELLLHEEGIERQQYALSALKIGLLSLRHARGQVDADSVRREGDRLLVDLRHILESSRTQLNENLTSSLREYFDPSNGKFQDRVERLIKRDGDLEQVLRRQIGTDSEMVRTLADYVGESSPLMKMLNPDEATGLVARLHESVEEVLKGEREQILAQFSLDDKKSAISRLVLELSSSNGNLQEALSNKVESVVKEFSLDEEDSALSRLVKKVEIAQQAIAEEFSFDNEESALNRITHAMGKATEAIDNNLTLDKEQSALFRLKRELLEVLNRHQQQANTFQSEVKATLAEIKAKREESARSTTHGNDFEDQVWHFVQAEAQRSGDIPSHTGKTCGSIRHCKVGDVTLELGVDSAAAGERIVIEAKEDESFDFAKASAEIQTARKNRDAAVGVFVFSQKSAPEGQETLLRHGSDIFVIWNSDELQSDVNLKAALMLAKALSVRQAKASSQDSADFQKLDKAILELEREAKRLTEIKKWTETIKSNSTKVLYEVLKMTDGVQKQIESLREATEGLKNSGERQL
jgi:hypothetical protein